MILGMKMNNLKKRFYDIVNNKQVANSSLGAENIENILRHKPGLALKRSKEELNVSLHLAAEFISINGRSPDIDPFVRSYQYFTPSFTLRSNKKTHLTDFSYNTSVNLPDVYQLLPVVNNIDPQQEIIGNPTLDPEYVHRFMLSYNYYNQFNLINFYTNALLNYTKDKIVNETTLSDDLIKRHMPINSNHSWYFQASAGLSTPLKPLRITSQLNYRTSFSQYKYVINGVDNMVKTLNQRISLSLNNAKQEKILIEPGFAFDLYSTQYDINKAYNTTTFDSEFFIDVEGYLPKEWTLKTSFKFRNYTSDAFEDKPRYYLLGG